VNAITAAEAMEIYLRQCLREAHKRVVELRQALLEQGKLDETIDKRIRDILRASEY
jgi:predicted Holliday junction resolvase-like endonuclease